jgi:hypothetical protein
MKIYRKIKSTADGAQPGLLVVQKKLSHIINIDTCIVGAFPHMWSLDKSILYLPNPKAPSFNIEAAFSGKDADAKFIDLENLDAYQSNLHPTPTAGISWTGTRKKITMGIQVHLMHSHLNMN